VLTDLRRGDARSRSAIADARLRLIHDALDFKSG
jgi:hypothetical protein